MTEGVSAWFNGACDANLVVLITAFWLEILNVYVKTFREIEGLATRISLVLYGNNAIIRRRIHALIVFHLLDIHFFVRLSFHSCWNNEFL